VFNRNLMAIAGCFCGLLIALGIMIFGKLK
jgi:hypothetical protein